LLTLFAYGQADTTVTDKPDTSRFSMNDTEVWVISSKEDTSERDEESEDSDHWGGLWMGVNGYMTPDNQLQMKESAQYLDLNYAKSFNWRLNYEVDIPLYREYVKVITGLGFDFRSYGLLRNYTFRPGADSLRRSYNKNLDYSTNNLNVTYLNVPLMFAINSHRDPEKSFHLAAGMVGGYRIFSAVKQKYKVEGTQYKDKVKGNYHLHPFRYGLITQIGYGNYNLFASYDLSGLFQGGGTPKVYPFTLGLRVIGW
jgi:hypothetical protein